MVLRGTEGLCGAKELEKLGRGVLDKAESVFGLRIHTTMWPYHTFPLPMLHEISRQYLDNYRNKKANIFKSTSLMAERNVDSICLI